MIPCACLGPRHNEPFCECVMVVECHERSAEFKTYMLPENVKQRKDMLSITLAEIFEGNKV